MKKNLKTILIIEDDHDIRVTLRQVFEAADYVVLSAANGLGALDLLKVVAPPDLIVCDLNMPLMSGESFIKRKKEDPKIKDVPIIVISAFHEKFCKYPDVTCMPKPLDMYQLVKNANDAIIHSH